MRDFSRIVVLLSFMFVSGAVLAQKDTTSQLDTQKLIIIKPFSPTISDAVKIRQNPARKMDSTLLRKKEIEYDIYSIPVASTFTPEKGRAAGLKRARAAQAYDNYAAIGVGNYTNIFAEIYSNIEISKQQNVTLELEHNSSQGGIKEAKLTDKYYDTRFDLGYTAEEDSFFWNAKVGLLHQHYNWYGIFSDNPSWEQISSINPRHNYVGVSLGGDIQMKKGFFDKVSLDFRHFGDDYKGNENRIIIKPNFQFPVQDEMYINAEVFGDFLTGKFGNSVVNDSNFGWFNFGFHPSINLTGEDFALNIGGQLAYSADLENDNGEVYIYPKIKGSYRIAGEYMTVYTGVEGGLKQNSYYEFAQGNPYLAPDLRIMPTHNQYSVYFGTKGNMADGLQYDLRASFSDEENKPLYAAYTDNDYVDYAGVNLPDYTHASTFKMVYDKVKTLSLHAGVNYEVFENVNLGTSATYFNYSMDEERRAWNLPDFQASFNADYRFAKKWSVGADVLFVGERRDQMHNLGADSGYLVKVDNYLDANLRVDFQLTDQFGIFARGNNLFNSNYDRWFHYPVQGIQGMLGLSYQF